ncbi:hypothetical protein ACOSQ4_012698 [Xanthoceras sorbifolium]
MGSWYIFTSSVFLRHYADTPHLVPLPYLPLAALCLIYAHISLTGHSPPHAILPLFSWLTCLRKSIETINTISEDAPKLREIMTEIKKMMPSIKLIMAKVVESLPWLKETHLNFYYVSALRKPKSIETINAISEDAPKLREIMTEIKKMMPSIKLIMAKVVESLPWLKETHLNFYYVSALRKPKVNHGFLVPFLRYRHFYDTVSILHIWCHFLTCLIYAIGPSPPHAVLPLFS